MDKTYLKSAGEEALKSIFRTAVVGSSIAGIMALTGAFDQAAIAATSIYAAGVMRKFNRDCYSEYDVFCISDSITGGPVSTRTSAVVASISAAAGTVGGIVAGISTGLLTDSAYLALLAVPGAYIGNVVGDIAGRIVSPFAESTVGVAKDIGIVIASKTIIQDTGQKTQPQILSDIKKHRNSYEGHTKPFKQKDSINKYASNDNISSSFNGQISKTTISPDIDNKIVGSVANSELGR